jgi:hypothetical protein
MYYVHMLPRSPNVCHHLVYFLLKNDEYLGTERVHRMYILNLELRRMIIEQSRLKIYIYTYKLHVYGPIKRRQQVK